MAALATKLAATMARLSGQRVYIDTNVFIYFLDKHDTYFELVSHFFQACIKRLKFIDALHLATAVQAGCQYLITNDAGISSSEGLEVISLADLL